MDRADDIIQIRKYLNGELNARAMHELEHRALDDPFLADALEGFEHASSDQEANLAELTDRLHQRTEKKSRKIIHNSASNMLQYLILGKFYLRVFLASVCLLSFAKIVLFSGNRSSSDSAKIIAKNIIMKIA